MSPKHIFYTIFLGLSVCLASCNGNSSEDDTDTGDSRIASDESSYKDRCDEDSEDDCFQLRTDITVFNPDDFSDVEDFRVIYVDEDDGPLKDGDVVVEMMLKDGAPLPEPVEVGRILYRKKGNQITVRRIKGVQQDGNMARFLTENIEMHEVFRRWRMRGRWGVDLDTGTAVKLENGEEPGDRVRKVLDCAPEKTIEAINNALPEGVTAGSECTLTFELVAEVQNVGGFTSKEGVSKIGVVGSAEFYADASLTTSGKLSARDGTAAKLIDFNGAKSGNRISVPLGPILLKIGAKFKVVATSDRSNRMETYVTARIEAGPVVKKTAKKGYEFTFFEKRVTDDPTGGDGYCDGNATGGRQEDNPCFHYQFPYLLNDGQMSLKVGVEPEILVTSPIVGGLAGITIGMYTFGEFEIEGEVDRTEIESLSADGFISGYNLEQTSCWDLNVGFTPTIGVEVVGQEIAEFNVATFKQPLWGECGTFDRTLGGDTGKWCKTIDDLAVGDVRPGDVIDDLLGPALGDGLCVVNRHCTLLEQSVDNRPDIQCVVDQPTCNTTSCICDDPTVENGGIQTGPDFVSSVKIRDAWMHDTESYCCLPQELIKERKEAEAADPGGPNNKGVVYWNSFSCNDDDFSTVDTCVEGACQYEKLPGSCVEDTDCDPNEVWVAEDDSDRDLGEMAPAERALVAGVCHKTFILATLNQTLLEKRYGTRSYASLDEADFARLTSDVTSPLYDDGGKLGQKDNLGVCMWDSVADGAGALPPQTGGLNCNVSTQKADCDDNLPFTFDYCAPDEEVLTYSWASLDAAPDKWGRCYHGIRACPRKIRPLLDAGAITNQAMLPCCEQRIGRKIKADEKFFVTTSGPGTSGEYDWTCGQVVTEASPSTEWSPGD